MKIARSYKSIVYPPTWKTQKYWWKVDFGNADEHELRAAVALSKKYERVIDDLGIAIMRVADHMMQSHIFKYYSQQEDIKACMIYFMCSIIKNIDTNKNVKITSYLMHAARNSGLHYIEREKKQYYIKRDYDPTMEYNYCWEVLDKTTTS